jgi:hypothetical protein
MRIVYPRILGGRPFEPGAILFKLNFNGTP